MTNACHIRPYRLGDEKGILELRSRVFGDLDPVRRHLHVWKWQFQDNPAGRGFCYVAEDGGKIVGQYAAIPTRFSVYGKETLLAMSCDTMIDPQYRRQGLFVQLARRLYEQLEARHDIDVVWGFPNRQSLPGFVSRLDWRMASTLSLMVRPLRPLAMLCRSVKPLRRFLKIPEIQKGFPNKPFTIKTSTVRISSVTHFDTAFDQLWKTNVPMNKVIQIRDSRYLNWRYMSVSDFEYRPFAIWRAGRLTGYVVLRMMGIKHYYFGVIVDLFPFPRDAFLLKEILSFSGNYVKAQRGDFLTCLSASEKRHALKKVGFIRVPEFINPKTWYFGYRCRTNQVPAHWHITYGDTDVV